MSPREVIYDKHCKVLIRNEEVRYHYEVLQSAVALYPLPRLLSCNRSQIKFTIANFTTETNASWYEYATQTMARCE
jgi:hypothetical protein